MHERSLVNVQVESRSLHVQAQHSISCLYFIYACVYTHVKSTQKWESILKETDVGMMTLNDWCHVRRSDASPGEFLPQIKKPKTRASLVTSCVKTFEATSTTRQVPCYWVNSLRGRFSKKRGGIRCAIRSCALKIPSSLFLFSMPTLIRQVLIEVFLV